MTIHLLTPEQVAEQLIIDVKKVSRLPIIRVRIGTKILRYRQEDVDLYIRERLEAPGAQSAEPALRRKNRTNEVGAHLGLIPREALDQILEDGKAHLANIEQHSAEEKRRIARLKWIAKHLAKKKKT